MQKTLSAFLLKMIPVTLGVLIALFLNSWKEKKDNERFLKSVFSSIEQEMREDREEITEILPKQYALIDTITLYLEDDQVSILDCLNKTNGLKVLTVKNASWWSFLSAKVEIVGYETIAALGEIEEGNQFMNVKLNKLMDYALENTESRDASRKKLLIIHLLNLVDSEEGMLKRYESYLRKVNVES